MFAKKRQMAEEVELSPSPSNKRAFFRLPCHIQIDFTLLRKNEYGRLVSAELHKGTICDLSGGGVKVLTEADMEIKDRIFLTLQLDDDELFLTGDIKTKSDIPEAYGKERYGIVFLDITEIEQDKIVRYLLKQQYTRAVI